MFPEASGDIVSNIIFSISVIEKYEWDKNPHSLKMCSGHSTKCIWQTLKCRNEDR